MSKTMICILCPRGCRLRIDHNNKEYEVSGNQCSRGLDYALREMHDPMRVLTTTVKTDNPETPRVPVRLSKEIPLRLFREYMDVIDHFILTKSCLPGDRLIKNVLAEASAPVDLIATGAYNSEADKQKQLG